MKITPNQDRLLVRLADPTKEKSAGGIIIPNVAQVEPKVFEATVLSIGPEVLKYKVNDRLLIPGRILGDRLSDGTVFVREHEVFGKVEDSLLVEATASILVPK